MTVAGYFAKPTIDLLRKNRDCATVPPYVVLKHADGAEDQPHQQMDLTTPNGQIRADAFGRVVETRADRPSGSSRVNKEIEQTRGEQDFTGHG